jgi:2-haloacid dehalogenase
MNSPQAVLFDAYGTLFDVHSVASLAEQSFPGQGAVLSQHWRDKQIEYTRLVSMSANERGVVGGGYRSFWDLTRLALQYAARKLGLVLDGAMEDRLMNAYRALAAFPDVKPVLQSLHERGVSTGILSNGDPKMLEIAVRSAQLGPLLTHVLSADTVRRYKTDPAVYALGPQALGLPARQILFVSSNGWDALGATLFGYTTLWVNRTQAPPETLGPAPTYVGSRLHDVLECLAPGSP